MGLSLGEPGPVEVAIFDVTGDRVRTLLDGFQPAGERDLQWDLRGDDGRLMGAGLYFLRVSSAGQRLWRKIVLL